MWFLIREAPRYVFSFFGKYLFASCLKCNHWPLIYVASPNYIREAVTQIWGLYFPLRRGNFSLWGPNILYSLPCQNGRIIVTISLHVWDSPKFANFTYSFIIVFSILVEEVVIDLQLLELYCILPLILILFGASGKKTLWRVQFSVLQIFIFNFGNYALPFMHKLIWVGVLRSYLTATFGNGYY